MTAALFLVALFMGARHALEADHVAAVASMATRSSSLHGTVETASVWGLGHAVSLFVLGAAVVGLGLTVPPSLSIAFEAGVGALLVWLGIDVLRRARRRRLHAHVHEHRDGRRHVHVHAHDPAREPRDASHHRHDHPRTFLPRAFLVGGAHGLAGSAALVLASLQTAGSPVEALAVLLTYGIGAVLGMVAFSVVIVVPFRFSGGIGGPAWRRIETALGTTTAGLGVWVAAKAMGL